MLQEQCETCDSEESDRNEEEMEGQIKQPSQKSTGKDDQINL